MKGLIIFDMDGTIVNTSEGIYASYKHIAHYLGVDPPSEEVLSKVLGGSLPSNLKKVYNLKDDKIQEVVDEYREYYAIEGIKGTQLYEGFDTTAKELSKRGYILAVATMKAETFAKRILINNNLNEVFKYIHGVNPQDTISKTDMIKLCMSESNITSQNTFMIGDSNQDYDCANKCGVNFLAVTYGFHYTEEICKSCNLRYILSPQQLLTIFK
jgi:phosphoglycolate phosphatase